MITLYSNYFNSPTRRLGRKIKAKNAEKYSDERLLAIFKELKLKYEVRDARYSRMPYESSKMFILDTDIKKSTLLKIIEERL
ncbi:MAG: signal recognition particle [Ferroplasma sp.]